MPPRLSLFGASRSLTIRSRSSIVHQKPAFLRVAARRGYADAKDFQPATGPNQDVLGHVSEEAADMSDVTGETKPDISQGTPVQEVNPPSGAMTSGYLLMAAADPRKRPRGKRQSAANHQGANGQKEGRGQQCFRW